MPFVLGVERHPRRALADPPLRLPDVLTDAAVVVGTVLELVRDGGWVVGVGAGPVEAADAGTASGTAARCARRAVDEAGRRPAGLAVRGQTGADAADAQAVLGALAALVTRRSDQAWAAIDLLAAGSTQAQAAVALGVSRQAVGQRLAAAGWDLERELRQTAARLLDRAAR